MEWIWSLSQRSRSARLSSSWTRRDWRSRPSSRCASPTWSSTLHFSWTQEQGSGIEASGVGPQDFFSIPASSSIKDSHKVTQFIRCKRQRLSGSSLDSSTKVTYSNPAVFSACGRVAFPNRLGTPVDTRSKDVLWIERR